MTAITRVIRRLRHEQGGLTLVEVVVAMFIFAIISTGALYTMGSILSVTRDTRAREVAANLAAQEIDLVRTTKDLFKLEDFDSHPVYLNGDTFTVIREAGWSNGEGDVACGGIAGNIRYKFINVTVKWDNMRPGSKAVRIDTVIDPKNRLNDPALGTILVSAKVEAGTGSAGVTVTATPANSTSGAVALTTAPNPTDSKGCSYILKVAPGDYNVTITRANSIDATKQSTSPSQFVQVTAGRSTAVSFAYDYSGTINATYATNYNSGSTPKYIPTNLDTSFIKADDVTVSPATNSNLNRSVDLYPWSTGYTVLAGKYVKPSDASAGCISVDPAAWPIGVEGLSALTGKRPASVAALPKGSAVAPVQMGLFAVRGMTGDNKFLMATSATTTNLLAGDPGCAKPMTYQFGEVLPSSPSNVSIVALPWGSWKLYTGKNASTLTTQIPAANITPLTRGSVTVLDGVLTLDPRSVTP